ncbi:MAG TPA: hypothetical protein VK498_14245 [Ferruginibacter sp.]|nr:hypothetical protein [Ferruginibacter sp.]
MRYDLAVIIILILIIAGTLAIGRYKKIHNSYYPFLYLIWLGCINELLSLFLVLNGYQNAINNNIYVLGESLLILYFFKNLKMFNKTGKIFLVLLSALIILWFYENLILWKITSVSTYFRITYSFIAVLLSITSINNLLLKVRKNIFTNPDFLVCAGFIIFFTYKILVEVFWLYGLTLSTTFRTLIYGIMDYINLFCNILFALAVLWMPRKQIFTMST